MKASQTTLKVITAFVLLLSYMGFAQEYNTFDIRYQDNIKGNLTFIGNNIVNRDGGTSTTEPNDAYNNLSTNGSWNTETGGVFNYNDYKDMQYIDIDGDPTTFSSSTATFTYSDATCSAIRYAGLYWTATYPSETANGFYNGYTYIQNSIAVGTGRQSDFNQVKFRVPGGSYIDITADEILYDGFTSTDNSMRQNSPYACYADVTSLVAGLANPEGDYTVANIRSVTGSLTPGGGAAGGWTLVIVYENPTLTGKLITTFDGFARVNGTNSIDINYSGFNTIPAGPVNADIGVGALEGDYRIDGDGMSIRAASNASFTTINNATNPSDNFFNSNITLDGVVTTNRNPASENTLGYDTDIFLLSNPSNSVIPNTETDATFRFSTDGDQYYPFFNSFNVEIIEPNIILEKRVEDLAGIDITGAGVHLGQYLDYVLHFVNTGNDNATNYTIRDVLPINTTLDESHIDLPLGVTYTYNAALREIVFTIPDNLVEVDDPMGEIRMRVRVAENCYDFIDACTDLIENLAYSTYQGVINNNQITDDPSVSDFDNCGFTTPGATNFLLDDLSTCDFTRTVQLCGEDVLLDAGDNFDAYTWYRDENGNNIIDAADTVITDADLDNDPSTLLVNSTGTYIVDKDVADPCKGFQEVIVVTLFGTTQTNPISALINDSTNSVDGEVLICPNDGEELPEIFLCGLNDTELIQINIPDAHSIVWEQLDETSCSAATPDCANKNNGCFWNSVGTGNDFLAQDSGQYRLVINYQNGCFSRFYFNIYKNPLNPQYNSSDIICATPGNITITNMPLDYEYQLLDATTNNVLVAYNSNPSFTITTNGIYAVEMRQQGVVDGCVFMLDNIGIRSRDFQVDVSTKDTDCNGLGEISIAVLDVEPQYYYELSQGGVSVDTFGPTTDNNHTFANLNDGTYAIEVRTDDGCLFNGTYTINDVTDLAVNALVTKAIDCFNGTIQVTGSGGFPNPDYFYAIWSYNGTDLYPNVASIPGGAYQISPTFSITAAEAGDYEFIVVDGNNCYALSNSVSIGVQPAVDYTTNLTNETCFGYEDGSYTVTVNNSYGYSLSYTLTYPDATTASNTSGIFTGLPRGGYALTITQTLGGVSCDYVETFSIGGPTAALSANAVRIQDYTCLQTGIIEAQNVAGGTPPYEYAIDGINFVTGFGSEQFNGLTNGTYNITVRDANGCTFTTNSVIIDPFTPPSDLTFVDTEPTCANNTSDVTVTVVDGEAPYTVEVISPSSIAATSITGNVASFNNLAPDSYMFRVTDGNGCTYEESHTIAAVVPISVMGQLVSNVSCFTATDGEISFTISNFSVNYDYNVTGPSSFSGTNETAGTQTFNTLDDGSYTITVTDTVTGCTATATVVVNAPTAPLTLSASETQPTCLADGEVVLTATGGWGSNSFTLLNPDGTPFGTNSTGTFTNLVQTGTYTASVTDANSCSVTTSFILNGAIPPILGITPNDFCYDATVGLTLTAAVTSGGNGNFEYNLNGGAFSTTNTFTGLGPGTYTISVRDGNDCSDTQSITINPELTVTATASNITSCGTDTVINISAAGGDGINYVYAVSDGVTPTPGDFGASNTITVTGAGNYDVYVRDNNGNTGYCEARFDITIAQDSPLTLSITTTDVICNGDDNGTITIVANGGEAPYEYSIDGGTSYQILNTFNNLTAANYAIRVRDANNCTIDDIASISQPDPLSASAAVISLTECYPGLGAEVRITNANGGTAPYEYSFDGGLTYVNNPTANLLPGNHTLFTRDANGCTFPITLTIDTEPSAPEATATISYECDGEGTVTINTPNPNYDYTYELNGNPNSPIDNSIFENVAVGNHTITVNYTNNAVPPQSTLLSEDFGQGANTSISEVDSRYCFEPLDGTGIGCNSGSPNALSNGEYTVTHQLTNPWSGWRPPNDHTGNVDGRFLAIDLGTVVGLDGIIYAKRNIEIIPNRNLTISMYLFNMVRDTWSGSQNDPNVRIELIDPLGTVIDFIATGNIPRNTHPDDWHNYSVDLNPGSNTTIDIVIRTNINTNHGNDLAIDDIEAFQTPEVCSQSLTIPVTIDPGNAFEASVTAFDNISCNGGSDGSITFAVENFDAVNGFEYALNGGAFSGPQTSSPITLTGLSAMVHTIELRDVLDHSCTITLSQTLTEPTPVVASASITNVLTCTNGGATITASASGGTPNYEYELQDAVGTAIAGYDFATNGTNTLFTGLAAGDYIVVARDTNGCVDPIDTALNVATPATPAFNLTETLCYSGANDATIQVDVTAGNGNYQFSLNGGAFIAPTPSSATTHTFTGLAAGTYTIDVRDQYGCAAPQQSITIQPQLTVTATAPNITSCGTDTNVNITAAGGDGNHVYAVVSDGVTPTPGDFGASNTITVTGAGNYDVYVRDNNGGAGYCEASFDITITQDAPLSITPTVVDVTCFGSADGSISLIASGGETPYLYSIDNGTNYQTSGSFANLSAGTYPARIQDANGCETTLNVTVNEPAQLVAEATITQAYDCTQLGAITVGSITPTSGGSGNYQYSLNGGTWSAGTTGGTTYSGLTDGTYTISVRDANAVGCTLVLPNIIIAPLPVEPTPSVSIAYNCDGTADITVSPTDPSYNYSLNAGVFQASNTFTDLPVGTHTVTIDYGSNCTVDTTVVIDPGNAFEASVTAFDNISCNGGSDGSITFTVENFDVVNGFEYALNGGAFSGPQTSSTITLTGLSAMAHTIELRDVLDHSCTITLSQTLTEPTPVVASASITNVLTCTNGGATITASASGGTPNYEYELQDAVGTAIAGYDFATNGTNTLFTGLAAGDYIVVARDTNGCEDTDTITVIDTIPVVFDAVPTACYSGNNDGSIVVNVTGGNGGYQFRLNGGPWITPTPVNATTHTFNNLTHGSYTIEVRDSYGCPTAPNTLTRVINPQLLANAVLTSDLTCSALASVTINASGGSGSYSYEWSNNGGASYASTNFSGNVFSTNTYGTFVFRVTDTTSPTACTVETNTVIISEAETPMITAVNPTPILCNGDTTGVLDVIIDTSIGLPPYTINVVETSGPINYGTQTTNLPAGNYEVTITDAKGCTSAAFPVSISEPTTINPNVTHTNLQCVASTTQLGTITVNASGGTPTYIYRIYNSTFTVNQTYDTSTGTNDHIFTGLDFGDYTVSVTDANGCEQTSTVTITTGPDVLITTVGAAGCLPGSGSMEVQAQASNGTLGTGVFYFAIYPAPAFNAADPAWFPEDASPPATVANSHTFTGLNPGVTYTFVVHDSETNCEYVQEATVPVASTSTLAAVIDSTTNITCTGTLDGESSFTISGYSATNVDYEVFASTTNTTTGITGSITGVVGGPETATITGLGPGEYYILFTEVDGANAGCVMASPTFTIQQSPNLLRVTAASPTNDNCNLNAGMITATAQFGTAPYEFQYLLSSVSDPAATDAGWTTATSANVEAGDYIVYVKDANNCIQNDAVTVRLDADPQISLAIVDECVDEGMFEVLVTLNNPAAAMAPFTLRLNGGPAQNITFNASNQYTVSGLSSGVGQTIMVSDVNGCADTQTIDIHPPLQFNAMLTKLLDCSASPNAAITIDVTVGSGLYEYEIDGPGAVDQAVTAMGGTSVVWTGASVSGSYTITVYDTSTAVPYCLGTFMLDVPAIVNPVFTETHIDVSCNGAADGSISLFATDNGLVPLTYAISPVAGSFNATTNTYENLPAGFYTVTATGTNDCTETVTVTIGEPAVLTVPLPSVAEFGCTTGNNPDNATVTVNTAGITGGSGNYVVYEFIDNATATVLQSGSNNIYVETNFAGRTLDINVYDDNGCVGPTTATVQPFDELLSANISIGSPISCVNNEDITITATGALTNSTANPANYEFRLLPAGPFQTSGSFPGLTAGTHNFEVRNAVTGCLLTIAHTVAEPNTFSVDVNVLNNVECFGSQTGQIAFELVDTVSPLYTGDVGYTVYDSASTPVASGTFATTGPNTVPQLLFAGAYTLEVVQTNFPECTNTTAFNIASPPAAITANRTVNGITCLGNDGEIEITDAAGGWGSYRYYVGTTAPAGPASYLASPVFAGLAPGTYQLWVRDGNGCEEQLLPNVTLNDPTPITATLQVNNDNCTNIEGEIQVVGVSGGQGGNYTYQLIGNGIPVGSPQPTDTFSNLGGGSYTVLVADQWSCTFTTAAIVLYDEMVPVANVVKDIDCSPSPDGGITISVTGGSGNFDYTVTFPDAVTTMNNTTGIFTGLSQVGSYTFVVNDLDTASPVCSKTVSAALTAPTPVTLATHDIVDVGCNGGADGSITINLAPTTAGVNDDPVYSFILYDDVSRVTPIAGPQHNPTFDNLSAGTYWIEAISGKQCLDWEEITIGEPAVLTVPLPSVIEFGCTTGNNPDNATVTVNTAGITGGSGNYVVYEFIDNATATVLQSGSNNIYVETNFAGRTLDINVYDDNGCVGPTTATVQPFDELLSANISIGSPISCVNNEDITITATGALTNSTANPANYEFRLLPAGPFQTSGSFPGLTAGTHNFEVRNAVTGCLLTIAHTVAEPNTFSVDVNVLNNVECFGSQTGQIAFELVDTVSPLYTGDVGYTVYDSASTPVASGTFATTGPNTVPQLLFAGAYTLEVVQTNFPECTNTTAFNIASPPAAITANRTVNGITCLGNDGEIEITDAAGGWGSYRYYVGTTAPAGPASYLASPVFAGLAPGTYQLWVRDGNGCEEQLLPNVTLNDPTPITATLQVNNDNCTNIEGEIQVVGVSGGQGGNYTYQLIGNGIPVGSPQPTDTFSNLGGGSYTVLVADQWSCTFTTAAIVLYDEMVPVANVVKDIDCSPSPDGGITISVTGGSGNFDYTVTFPDAVTTMNNTTGIFTGLSQVGSYTFVVNDLDTASPVCSKTVSAALTAPTPVTLATHDIVDVGCNGGADGSITINLAPTTAGVNDDPVYSFILYDDVSRVTPIAGPQHNPTFDNLSAGTYWIEAISGKQCLDWEEITIGEPAVLAASASATAFACNSNNTVDTSIITVSATGGAGGYLYSIDGVNFQTSNTFEIADTGSVQNLTIIVEDGNGCQTTAVVPPIAPLNVFTALVSQSTAISCANPEEVLITITDNGNPANSYTFDLLPIGNSAGSFVSNPTPTSALFTLTDQGSYVFRITDTVTGCSIDTAPYTIAPYDTIELNATATSAAICFGDANGVLELSISGYTGDYDYELFLDSGVSTGITGSTNTSINPLAIPRLSGGNYYVTVTETDHPLCVGNSNSVTIVSPDMPLALVPLEIANVTCTNDQGEIEISPTGGYAPYDVVMTHTATGTVYTANAIISTLFYGLASGDYQIDITDNNSCSITENIILTRPNDITTDITATPTTLQCFGDTNAQVAAQNVMGGQGVYQYQLNVYDATGSSIIDVSGYQNSPLFDNLGAGIYSITVSDGWNCGTETPQVIITEPSEVQASLVQTSQMTCLNQAQMELTAGGGTAPYTYSVDGISFAPMSGGNTHSFTVAAGNYQYFVRDAFGCESMLSNEIVIDPIDPLTLDVDLSAALVNCTGEASATIRANATGGLGNYSFELFTDATLNHLQAGPQANGTFASLTSGSYYIRVTSSDCITVSNEIVIVDPTPLQIVRDEFTNISCNGANDGTITVEVSGGTGNIFYAISPNLDQFDTVNSFTGLTPGIYDVIAQDQNGCFIPFQFTIIEPTTIEVNAINIMGETCSGNDDGMFDIQISGGTAPYYSSLDSNADADFVLDQISFANVAPGTHVVFVRDSQGCENNVIVEIESGVNINATVTPMYECTGNIPENRLEVVFEDETISTDVMYALDSSDTAHLRLTSDYTNIPAGDHYLYLLHSNGCQDSIPFTIEGYEPLTLNLEQNDINEITAVAQGGLEDYTFYFDDMDSGTDNTFIINRTDTYTVRVVDQNGCEAMGEIEMEFIDIQIPDFFTPDGDGLNDEWVPDNTEAFPNVLTIIFDRYGRELYRMKLNDAPWDGIYQGNELPSGDYWYIIKLRGENDDREFIGHFTLYR